MGGLGPLDWPKTLGKMAADLAAVLDGVRRHETEFAATLRETPATGVAAAILAQPPGAEPKALTAARAEVSKADAAIAHDEAAVRAWLDSYRAWAKRVGAES